VLDSLPLDAAATGLTLARGSEVVFGPGHVADISTPPRACVLEQFGADFFER
jgi:hypothetical protein